VRKPSGASVLRVVAVLKSPLTVAWISDFPIEWMPDLPEQLRALPRRHPATWQMVLLSEFEKNPDLKIHVVLLRHRMEREVVFSRNGVTFHVLKARPWARLASLFWLDTVLIRRACKAIKPDLVHAWGNEKGAAMIGHRLGYAYLMTVQGLYGWYKERVPLGRYDRLMEKFERASFTRTPVVTTESTFAVKYLKENYASLKVVQAEHAPNRVFAQVRRQPRTDPFHFISIGTLGFRKGTDLLFKALDKLTKQFSFRLTVISNSNPPYLASLKQTVSSELWGRVEFKHLILPNEVAELLVTPTMLLLPTRADTSPNAVKEAVVAGVPVVASKVGGIPDYVFPGKNGILFESDDLDGFVGAIKAACEHPLFRWGEVDPQTLALTRDYLSPERMAANFLKAYEAAVMGG
jgi:glycosyltransferase involved in cell wall biosynthesis